MQKEKNILEKWLATKIRIFEKSLSDISSTHKDKLTTNT